MAKYIDADEFKRNLNALFEGVKKIVPAKLRENTQQLLNYYVDITPAADVRPEKHGRWMSQEGAENFIPFVYHPPERWKCSLCDYGVNDDRFCYCPHCGAKMGGKGGESDE